MCSQSSKHVAVIQIAAEVVTAENNIGLVFENGCLACEGELLGYLLVHLES